jgi:small subunit ribosomal protein S2
MLKKKINTYLISVLLENQLHIGKKKKKWNKSLNVYLFGLRHDIFFFNLQKTQYLLKKVVFFLQRSISRHHSFLFVGTGSLIHPLIRFLSMKLKQPCANIVWIGGTLSSWFTIQKYAKRLYTKGVYKNAISQFALKAEDKVRQKIHRYSVMKERLKGLETASRFPNMVICFDKMSNEYALHEAYLLQLPTICMLNSDQEFSRITYPILGNNNSMESLSYYTNLILNSMKEGLLKRRLNFLNFNNAILKDQQLLTSFLKGFSKLKERNKKRSLEVKKINSFIENNRQYNLFFIKKAIRRFYYYFRKQKMREYLLKKNIKNKKIND